MKGVNDTELLSIVKDELEEKLRKALQSVNSWIEEEKLEPKILVEYSQKYLRQMKKKVYQENWSLIKKVEGRIEQYFFQGESPGGSQLAKLDGIKKTNNLHANIPEPLGNPRIVYEFDKVNKKILFMDIGTHKELGFGGSGS